MKKINELFIYFFWVLCFYSFETKAQTFTPGNFVVCRIGDGTSAITTSAALPVFLDEFTPTGTLVQSIALPTTSSGTNRALTLNGNSTIAGLVSLSSDGQYLLLIGFDAAVGTSVGSTDPAIIARTIGTIKYNGTINTTTGLTDIAYNSTPNCVTSADGTTFWATSQGAVNNSGGIRYTTLGGTSSVAITSNAAASALAIVGGQLYCSEASLPRVGAVGTGIPNTAGQTINALPGFPTNLQNPDQFVFFDLDPSVPGVDVLYVANHRSDGGIQKYSLVGGNWTSSGTVGPSSNQYVGLSGILSGGTVTLFSTCQGSNSSAVKGGNLVLVTDASGYNGTITSSPTVLSSISTRFGIVDVATYRGIALIPKQTVLSVSFLEFSGLHTENSNALNWSTATESNNLGFEVQRSLNSTDFEKVGFVASKAIGGNSTSTLSYDFIDNNVTSPKSYYRLKQVDKDGKTSYSKTILINTSVTGITIKSFSPNPVGSTLTVNIESASQGRCTLLIYDGLGKNVFQKAMTLQNGSNAVNIDASALPKGVLNITIVGTLSNQSVSKSFIKE